MTLAMIKENIAKGEYEQALRFIEELPESDHVEGKILECRVMRLQGEYEKAIAIVEHLFSLTQSIQNSVTTKLQVKILNEWIYVLWRLRKLEEALEKLLEVKALIKTLSPDDLENLQEELATLANSEGIIYYLKGDLDQALVYHEKSLSIREKLKNIRDIASSLNNIGGIYYNTGQLDLALNYYKRSLTLYEELGNKGIIAGSLNNIWKCSIGHVYEY